jgi:hypothetical protein
VQHLFTRICYSLCFALPETHERRERRFLHCDIKFRWLVIYPHFCFTLRGAPAFLSIERASRRGKQSTSEATAIVKAPKLHSVPQVPRTRSYNHDYIVMFARRVLKSSSSLSASSALRPFTTTTTLCRSPALADITPAGVPSFEAKQKEFRERMIEQAKKKDASQSRDALPRPPVPDSFESLNPPTAPNASNARSYLLTLATIEM